MKKLNLFAVTILFVHLQTIAQQEKQFDVAFNYQTLKRNIVNPANLKYENSNNSSEKDYAYYLQKKKSNLTAAVFLIAGAVSGISSIPLMIMASVYGHKAKLAFSNQKTGFGVPTKAGKNIPGLTFSIPLSK